MAQKGIFIGATGQNVGKTTFCLGLIALLQKRYQSVGFIKPVGQRHILTSNGDPVDKDVVLFKEHFNLKESYQEMSPILFPQGFTRDYLDGMYNSDDFITKIRSAYSKIAKNNDYMIVEGTGHIGVGSIADLDNAQVAKALDLEVILISTGGIGKAFDELALNRSLLEARGVKIKGVILNRVLTQKKAMVDEYITKALKRWNIPLMGSIPFNEFLNSPSMKDFETLFNVHLLSGEDYRYHHFEKMHFVSTSAKSFEQHIKSNQLIITSSTREDVVKALIDKKKKLKSKNEAFEMGLILTGKQPPKDSLLKKIRENKIPLLYTPIDNFLAMQKISSYTSKILNEDRDKVDKAISLIENHINLDLLCDSRGKL
ncbi:MAG: Phosphate acetyltransferase [Chlamydiae bacterium]|nr:Phosphate acetyltransferase [Chlamydiota bacterium]